MLKWIKIFISKSPGSDLLIMDNLSSHKNKGVLKELKNYVIIVRSIHLTCVDVFSVFDNFFFCCYL